MKIYRSWWRLKVTVLIFIVLFIFIGIAYRCYAAVSEIRSIDTLITRSCSSSIKYSLTVATVGCCNVCACYYDGSQVPEVSYYMSSDDDCTIDSFWSSCDMSHCGGTNGHMLTVGFIYDCTDTTITAYAYCDGRREVLSSTSNVAEQMATCTQQCSPGYPCIPTDGNEGTGSIGQPYFPDGYVVSNTSQVLSTCGEQTPIKITSIANITPPSCTSLADPYTCINPSFVTLSTGTGDNITVRGQAYQGSADISNQITWTCVSAPGALTDGGVCDKASGTGSTFAFIPNPPAASTGRPAPLSYLITAQIIINTGTYQDTRVITQDSLDELRQEYEDFPVVDSQERVNFDKEYPAYAGLLGPAAEPNRFNGWHILRSLNGHARDTVNNYQTLNITSGYRTPVGNNSLRGSAANSNHQYGRALDFAQQRSAQNYDAFRAAFNAGAREDTYLQGSNGIRYFWYRIPPQSNRLPRGVAYIQGHAAWVN